MKKILLTPLFLALSQIAAAQCAATELPYVVTSEATAPSELPDCMYSSNVTFSSQEIFKTVSGPIPGFEGDVMAFNTVIDTQWGMPPNAMVGSSLYTRRLLLTPGVPYIISYRYANSNAEFTIDDMIVYLSATGEQDITVATHQDITGATATIFTSQPFTVSGEGEYTLWFDVWSAGTQGLFYLDDIAVYQEGTSGLKENALSGLVAYPNPVNDVLHLTNNSAIDSAELFSVTGQSLFFKKVDSAASGIDTRGLAAGVYVLALQAGNDKKTIRIVKQ